MKDKGFTLIELLAIIVILAIIAVITVPIILNIIENSKIGAIQNSAYGYKDAVEKYFVSELYNDRSVKLNGEYGVLNGVLNGNDIDNVEIPLSGKRPTSGTLIFSDNKLSSGCLTIDDYKVLFENGKVVSTLKGACFEYYVVTFNSNGGTDVASIRTLGGEVVGKPANPTKADTKFLGWYVDSEFNNKFDFSSSITENITLYAKWGTPTMDDDSWAEIKENLIADRNFYPMGSTKLIHFDRNDDGVDEYYKLRLVNTAACGDYTGSRTSCGVVFEFLTTIGSYSMNQSNTNAGGWYESAMRKYLNPRTETDTNSSSIFSKLPSDLQSVIIDTAPIVSGSGSGNVSNNVVVSGDFTGDKLYLLSLKEVGFSYESDNKRFDSDTRTLKYYVDNTSGSLKTKYSSTSSLGVDGSGTTYLLRTANYSYSGFFYCIRSGGNADGQCSASISSGVSPAFRILD